MHKSYPKDPALLAVRSSLSNSFHRKLVLKSAVSILHFSSKVNPRESSQQAHLEATYLLGGKRELGAAGEFALQNLLGNYLLHPVRYSAAHGPSTHHRVVSNFCDFYYQIICNHKINILLVKTFSQILQEKTCNRHKIAFIQWVEYHDRIKAVEYLGTKYSLLANRIHHLTLEYHRVFARTYQIPD